MEWDSGLAGSSLIIVDQWLPCIDLPLDKAEEGIPQSEQEVLMLPSSWCEQVEGLGT